MCPPCCKAGMPTRKKRPHPRSLDALFGPAKRSAKPKPRTVKKAPVRACPAGHWQVPSWKPGDGCLACDHDFRAAARAEASRREREAWSRANPTPACLRVRFVDTGRVVTYSIPRHLRPRGRRRTAGV